MRISITEKGYLRIEVVQTSPGPIHPHMHIPQCQVIIHSVYEYTRRYCDNARFVLQ